MLRLMLMMILTNNNTAAVAAAAADDDDDDDDSRWPWLYKNALEMFNRPKAKLVFMIFQVENPRSTIPADKFLFERVIYPNWQTFQSKLSKRYCISFAQNCCVSLSSEKEVKRNTKINNRFNVRCKPNVQRCLCFSN